MSRLALSAKLPLLAGAVDLGYPRYLSGTQECSLDKLSAYPLQVLQDSVGGSVPHRIVACSFRRKQTNKQKPKTSLGTHPAFLTEPASKCWSWVLHLASQGHAPLLLAGRLPPTLSSVQGVKEAWPPCHRGKGQDCVMGGGSAEAASGQGSHFRKHVGPKSLSSSAYLLLVLSRPPGCRGASEDWRCPSSSLDGGAVLAPDPQAPGLWTKLDGS